ncbi:RICIN domain-containing protein [Streptomyces sp. NBC_00841]|uniref:RICIN domain-containing protein n=1 Tax=Streptomyces sp. NBC_00841 TaxID=2975847 RepID=UPI003FA3B6E2
MEADDPVQPYRFTDADVRRSRPSRTSSRTTIRQSDKCLTATANGRTNLTDCDDTPAQTWQPGTDGSLLNPASGRCLTVPGSDIANGTPAELGDCDGTVNQKWQVPSFVPPHQLKIGGSGVIKPGSTTTVTTTPATSYMSPRLSGTTQGSSLPTTSRCRSAPMRLPNTSTGSPPVSFSRSCKRAAGLWALHDCVPLSSDDLGGLSIPWKRRGLPYAAWSF